MFVHHEGSRIFTFGGGWDPNEASQKNLKQNRTAYTTVTPYVFGFHVFRYNCATPANRFDVQHAKSEFEELCGKKCIEPMSVSLHEILCATMFEFNKQNIRSNAYILSNIPMHGTFTEVLKNIMT